MDQLLAFAAVVAAFTAVWASLWQARLQRRANKHALYEKRIRVFLSVMHFLSAVAIHARVELDEAFALLRATNEAQFLFGPEVQKLIDEIYKKGNELRKFATLAEDSRGNPEQLKKHRDREAEIASWLTSEARVQVKSAFRPYLNLIGK